MVVYLCYIGCLINLINNVTICGSLLLPLLCLSHKSEINCHNHTDTITPVRSHSLITFKTNKWNRIIISRLCFLGCCSCFSSDLCNEWSNFEGSLEVLENFSRICTGGTFVLNQWEFLHLVAATFRSKLKVWFFQLSCSLQFSFDLDHPWRVCQWQSIHFSSGPAAEGVGA